MVMLKFIKEKTMSLNDIYKKLKSKLDEESFNQFEIQLRQNKIKKLTKEVEELKSKIKKPIIKPIIKPECNCQTIEETEYIIADEVFLKDIITKYIEDNNYELTIYDKIYNSIYVSIKVKNIDISYRWQTYYYDYKFTKKACIACKTCLGWYSNFKLDTEPYEYVANILNEKINKYKLAQEICNIKGK